MVQIYQSHWTQAGFPLARQISLSKFFAQFLLNFERSSSTGLFGWSQFKRNEVKYFSVSHGYPPLCSAYMVSRVIAITLPAQASDIMSWFVQSQLADISSAAFRGMYLPAEEWFMTNISLFVVALLRLRHLSRTKTIVQKRKQVLINMA